MKKFSQIVCSRVSNLVNDDDDNRIVFQNYREGVSAVSDICLTLKLFVGRILLF